MEWTDIGIVLGTRRHGETSAILEVMTRGHGRHLGLVRGGRSRSSSRCCSPATALATWRARLDEHLGTSWPRRSSCTPPRPWPPRPRVYGVTISPRFSACCRSAIRTCRSTRRWPSLVASRRSGRGGRAGGALRAAGSRGARLRSRSHALRRDRQLADLVYVSPKSGRAVSREAGAPWHDKLLALPAFLRRGRGAARRRRRLEDGFRLTGFFLDRHVYEPRGAAPPEARAGFIAAVREHRAGGVGKNLRPLKSQRYSNRFLAKRALPASGAQIGFVLPKRILRPDVGKNLQPLKLRGYSVWLCFAKTAFSGDEVPIGFVLPKCALWRAAIELGLFCQNSWWSFADGTSEIGAV